MDRFQLRDRVIVVTGATGYLGKAIVTELLYGGATVVGLGRSLDSLNELRQALPEKNRGFFKSYVVDLRDEVSIDNFCTDLNTSFDAISGLVNCAYSGTCGDLDSIGSSDFVDACQLNMVAPFILVKNLLGLLISGSESLGSASIVNVSTMYASVCPDFSVYTDSSQFSAIQYGSSKAGMLQLTRYLAGYLGRKNIRVNAVAPGPFPKKEIELELPEFVSDLAENNVKSSWTPRRSCARYKIFVEPSR